MRGRKNTDRRKQDQQDYVLAQKNLEEMLRIIAPYVSSRKIEIVSIKGKWVDSSELLRAKVR